MLGITCDMWSFGVITFVLLAGYLPFDDNNDKILFDKIMKGKFDFTEKYWGFITANAKSFIKGLLTVDPDSRLTAQQGFRNRRISYLFR